jgi:signal transduction histidine kinase/DNA-binding response OmpR family regulator
MAFRLNSLWPLRRSHTIRRTLVHIVLACILPGWIGIAVLILGMHKVLEDRISQGGVMTAQALLLAVDRELATARVALEVLADTTALTSDNFSGFHKKAAAVSKRFPLNNIVLSDRSGQQLVNTYLPFGTKLPINANPAADAAVFGSGEPRITNLFHGGVGARPLIGIKVPVYRDGAVKYVLSMGLFPEALQGLLNNQKLPTGWIASIFDAAGIDVARNLNSERFVGQPGSPALMKMIARQRSGFLETISVDGFPVYSAFARSETTNWTVAIGIPTGLVTAQLYEFLSLSVAGALILLGIGMGFAEYKSKKITHAMRSLLRPAATFGDAERSPIPLSQILEIDEVGGELEIAMLVLQYRTEERDRAELGKVAAEGAARLKSEFIATVSHELRTPLTAIAATLAMIEEDPDPNLSGETKELIDIAHANSQRLHQLVNDILDIEKLEAGKVAFHMQRVGVGALLAQTMATNRTLAQAQGVHLYCDGVPGDDVFADPDRLTQVLSNLISNAVKFSSPGADVALTTEYRGDKVRISVRDHGPGVPEHFKARVFEKFAQADASDARAKGGTGLGLSIVKEIVERMGGTIGFADAPGGGAVFFVDLPQLGPARTSDSDAPILLCARSSVSAGIICGRLRLEELAVDWSQRAADAVTLAANSSYKAIVIDLQLPGHDAITLIQGLRKMSRHAETPIIATYTSFDQNQDDIKFANINIVDWIDDPSDVEELRGRIKVSIDRSAISPARILHADDDPHALAAVARVRRTDGVVVSAGSIDEARHALEALEFDLAIVDLELDGRSGMDLLPYLHDKAGRPTPVIIYSAEGANPELAAQVWTALAKSPDAVDRLVADLRRHVAKNNLHEAKKVEAA